MTSLSKPQTPLDSLDPEHQASAFAHCEQAGVTLEEGVSWLRETYNIQLSSAGLGEWLKEQRLARSESARLQQIREDTARAALLGKVFGGTLEISETSIRMIQQAIFQELLKPAHERDESRLSAYMNLAIKARAQDLKSENIALQHEKFKAALVTKIQAGLEALANEIQGISAPWRNTGSSRRS